MADSIRVSLPTSGDEDNDQETGPPQEEAEFTTPGDTTTQSQHRPQKRRRIPVACGACRSKKSRCDGYRPKCSSCQAQNIECVYLSPPISATTPVPRAFLQLVETRLAQLESDVRFLKDQNSQQSGSARSESNMAGRRESLAGSSYLHVGVPVPDHDAEEYGVSPDATDGIGSIEFTKEVDSGYYGPSSNIAFTRNIRRALHSLLSQSSSRHHVSDARSHRKGHIAHRPSLEVSRPSTPQVEEPSRPGVMGETGSIGNEYPDYLRLPPDEEMNTLVSRFFVDTGLLFPFVHGPSFFGTYNRVKATNFRKFRRSWLGLLNAILAMATVTSASSGLTATERAVKAEVYYSRAKALCLDQMFNGATLETVQAMLLMSQYLQGTHRSTTTWNVHGLAVKAAFQLGLHHTGSSKNHSPLEKEMRLRTWYGCIILDRTLSMTFGRPPSIPESYIRTPLPKLCEKAPVQQQPVDDLGLSTGFYVYTITLYRILWNILDKLFECNIGYPGNDILPIVSNILQVEQQLLEWQSSLAPLSSLITPQELRTDPDFSLPLRFRVILTLRYHNVRILAHRRMLDLYLANIERRPGYDAEDSILTQVGYRSRGICMQSAADLIAIVHCLVRSPGPKRGLLGAWWFTLYYTFNAALTIVALMLCQQVGDAEPPPSSYETMGISYQSLRDTLSDALACLPMIDKGNRRVDKCAKFAATLNHCLVLLEQPDDHFKANGHGPEAAGDGNMAPPVAGEAPSSMQQDQQQYAVPPNNGHSYAPIPIDVSHFDLGALGWENDGFLATLGNHLADGFQETDLFC